MCDMVHLQERVHVCVCVNVCVNVCVSVNACVSYNRERDRVMCTCARDSVYFRVRVCVQEREKECSINSHVCVLKRVSVCVRV